MIEKIREEQFQMMTWSLVILAAFAVAAMLYFTRKVMIPFVLAILITSMVSPIVDYQVRRMRLPRFLAVSVAMLIVIGIVAAFGLILFTAAQTVIASVDQYGQEFIAMADRGIEVLQSWSITVDKAAIQREIQKDLSNLGRTAVGLVTGMLTNACLILVFAIFLLTGRSTNAPQTGVYAEIDIQVRKYLAIKVVVSAVTGILVGLLIYMLGLRSTAFLFGVLTFLLNFIPSLGSIVATLLPIPIAFAQFGSLWSVALVIALPGSVQLLMGNLIDPKLQGTGLKLHPVVILLSLALWGLLWGVAGMVLAVPITAILRIVLIQFDTTKPIGDLLGGHLPQMELRPDPS